MTSTYQPRDPFRSARLIYRAVRTPEDNGLFVAINDDRIGFQNSNGANNRLPTVSDAASLQKQVAEECLLGAVICIAPDDTSDLGYVGHDGIPIGQINLKLLPPGMQHHRHTEITIDILPEYQRHGFGSEAIRWALGFAFIRHGLHRVKIRAFEWNEGAIRLYEKIGFQLEGRQREELWHEGRWWDNIVLGILNREWWDLQEENKGEEE